MIKIRLLAILIIGIFGITFGGLAQPISQSYLSGKISITLEQGLWKDSTEEISYQDVTLDLICSQNSCESEIWGFAPNFNQADHHGTATINQLNNQLLLQVNLTINRDPWQPLTGEATYEITLNPDQHGFVGSYQGTFQQKSLQGKATAMIKPLYPHPLAYHQPIQFQEHPRLLFRANMLPELRQKQQTKIGKLLIEKLQKTLDQPVSYDGYVPNVGYQAAGRCFLSLMNENPQQAEEGWQLVETAINTSYRRLFEASPVVAGVAIAYDFCYNNWEAKHRQAVTHWLAQQTQSLIEGTADKGWNPTAWSNWNGRARGAAGLAALAILKEPEIETISPNNIEQLLTIAQRNITRYLETAIGDHGFGTEGDHYTTEPWILTLYPFLEAYRRVEGKTFITENSHAAWLLPHYLMRIVPKDNTYPIPTYGRHRYYAGGSLFAMGLGSTPPKFLPGIIWGFNHYWGREGDQSFGIQNPLEGIMLFVSYLEDVKEQHPSTIFDNVLVDYQKGFYVFRNQWQNDQDFVASIYAKREFLPKSWSFPDAGSFRIWGLGEHWAKAKKGQGKPENENVIVTQSDISVTLQPIYFASKKDGSGIVSLQSKNWLRSFAVDYSQLSGSPGLFVLVDQFREKQKLNTWIMHTEGKVQLNNNQFLIQGDNNTTMQGTFITPNQVNLVYQSDEQTIMATGMGDFFVTMTVQKGQIPDVTITGSGLNSQVMIGRQIITFEDDHINLKNCLSRTHIN